MSDFDNLGVYGKLIKNAENSRALKFREIRGLVLAKIKCYTVMTNCIISLCGNQLRVSHLQNLISFKHMRMYQICTRVSLYSDMELKIVVSLVCCRPAAVGATLATASAVILIFADLMTEVSDASNAPRNAPTFTSFSLAFSTMLFAYGGTSAFPTIQADMKKPQKFPKAVLIAYIGKYINLTHLGQGVFFICHSGSA